MMGRFCPISWIKTIRLALFRGYGLPQRSQREGLDRERISLSASPQETKKKPMPLNTHRANGKKSKIRACVEHVFAVQKERMGLFIQTIGLDRARIKITFANLAYNLQRLVFWEKRRTITQ